MPDNIRGKPLRGKPRARYLSEDEPDGRGSRGLPCLRISAWNLKLDGAKQRDLVIIRPDEPQITVDNIEVGQFIYLLFQNEKVRSVIDTITSKVVLILFRFTSERLRDHDRTPVVFDFHVPGTKNHN